MAEQVVLLEDSTHRLALATNAATTAPPALITDGQDLTPWLAGSKWVTKHFAVRFTASGAANLTAISLWLYFDGAWSKLVTPIADMAFTAGNLSAVVVVDYPLGSRLAAAFTLSAGTVSVMAYPIDSYIYG